MTTSSWNEVAGFVSAPAHLATAAADGTPHVAIVSPAVDGQVVWFLTFASSKKARNLATNPRAALLCSQGGPEAYFTCDASIFADAPTKQRLWHSGLFAYPLEMFFGSPDNPELLVVRLDPVSAVVNVDGRGTVVRWRR